ncbi:MAG: peptide deformylase [Chitinivibrionia bacterium]|nr:peptide deformylase [Chitinivibrionia bacterium]
MSEDLQIYGSKLLRKKCEEVTVFDDELVKFTERLRELMYELDGVGLAAIQIGKALRIAAVDVPDKEKEKEAVILINPKIVWKSQEMQIDSEGCLSIPEIRATVSRPMSVTVEAVSEKGEPVVFENVSGFFARAIQHEIDHMDGILFVDKIDPLKKTLIAGKLKKIAKEHKDK